jgi:chemotaxis signal transduction protein
VSEHDRRIAAAEELRSAFDAAFAAPARVMREDAVALLAIRVAGEPAAVRVLETAGLMPAPRIVPVPSRRPELLGIAGVRGAVVPVYALARLLGRGDDGEPRWILLAGGGERIGLALSTFERHLVVSAHALRPIAQTEPGRAHVAELLHADQDVRPVLSVASLVRQITGG